MIDPTFAARSAALRALAARLDRLSVHGLGTFADERTWVGPTPQRCAADLRRLRADLVAAAADLRAAAHRLDLHVELPPVRT